MQRWQYCCKWAKRHRLWSRVDSVEVRLSDRMHGFLDLGSEQACSTRGCRCTALVMRSRLEGLRCDDLICINSLIGAEGTNVKIIPRVVKNNGWSRHPAVWIAECRRECDVRCILYAGIGIQYHLVG